MKGIYTLEDFNVKDKTVLLRVDINCPIDRTTLKIINDSRPRKFYSQIVTWDHRADFEQIRILPGYPEIAVDLSAPGYYKSYCSPFVAVQVAYRVHDAHEIDLYGVDLTNHPHLDSRICLKIKIHFRNLFRALSAQGVKIHVHGNGILTA